MKKIIFAVFSVIALVVLGFEVAQHEAFKQPAPVAAVSSVEKLTQPNIAYAQSLERGFADLAKRAIPAVVNISTYVKPRIQRGYYGGGMSPGQDEMFRRFFEEFFGGRMPPMRPGPQDNEDQEAEQNNAYQPHGLGTGFIIDADEGLILTNFHVIQGAEAVKVQFKEEDTELTPAEVIGRDPELDVALLKVKTKKLVSLPMGDSDAIEVGEYVVAIGNPLGYGHTVSHGILSAKGRRNPEFRMGKYLQTDASINPGNSGGPLINTKGEVVGINNAIDARAQGIGFAIPINLVKMILPQLKDKGTVSRGFLGVSAAELTPEVVKHFKLNENLKGVIVAGVSRGSPADKSGIRPGDVITAVNGEKLTNAQDLTAKITAIPVGQKAKVDFVRNGKEKSAQVTISERKL